MTELETYEHILSVAAALIAEKGFANTSMNDIVSASGISKGGIYWHFKSKDEIILAIVENIFEEQMRFLDAVLSEEGRATERIAKLLNLIGTSLQDVLDASPPPIDLYALAIRKPDLLAHIKQYFAHYQTHFVRLIQQGIQEGDFASENPERAAFIFMSAIEGMILVNAITQLEDNLADAINEASRIFLQGLQKKRED